MSFGGFAAMVVAQDPIRAPRLKELERLRRLIPKALERSPRELRTARRDLNAAGKWIREAQADRMHVADNMLNDVAVRFLGEAPLGWRWEQGHACENLLTPDGVEAAIVYTTVTPKGFHWLIEDEVPGAVADYGDSETVMLAKRAAIEALKEQGLHGLGDR